MIRTYDGNAAASVPAHGIKSRVAYEMAGIAA